MDGQIELSETHINYNTGPKFKCERDITKKDIVNLCNYMSSLDFYKDRGIVLAPEAICDGGITYIFKDNPLHYYKTIRFHFKNQISYWPWVERNALNTWKDSNQIIFNKSEIVGTYLKAFHGAPLFDMSEINLIRDCFDLFSMKKFKNFRIVKKYNDISYGPCTAPYTPEQLEEMNNKPDYNSYYLE
jgi:hypothetical protein